MVMTLVGAGMPFWDQLSPAQSARWEEEWTERAAVMEHHGGLATAAAEVAAYRLVEAEYRARERGDLVPLVRLGERAGLRASRSKARSAARDAAAAAPRSSR